MTTSRKARAGAVAAVALVLAGAALGLADAQEAGRKAITIVLLVPADARVESDGGKTTQTGERCTYETPPLAPGREFTYN